jgi:hypothetical protein
MTMPFSRLAIELCLNLVTVCLMLELRPWQPRPPWRTPWLQLVIWLIFGFAVVASVHNLSAWLVLYLYGKEGTAA